jgi:phenylalanyl-tRNA synthetase beta chain
VTLKALYSAVPRQPRHIGLVATGQRITAGWNRAAEPYAWNDALDAALLIARTVGVDVSVTKADYAPWHPGRCARIEAQGRLVGHAGELSPKVIAALGLPARTVAAEVDLDVLTELSGGIKAAERVATYPVAKEDVALVVDAAVPAATVEAALRSGGGALLESVRLFDVFTGEQIGAGKKSLAYALRFRSAEKTLKAEETTAARDAAVAAAAAQTGAVLRGVGFVSA